MRVCLCVCIFYKGICIDNNRIIMLLFYRRDPHPHPDPGGGTNTRE